MKYLSVCSGIEAATVAWHSLGWQAAAYSEIEPFPSAVLAHHYSDVPNVGDMTKYKEWNIEPGSIDLLVGGTPCQSFSVAGLRKGLADPRGNLALVYCGILDHLKPRWFVWENVPGVLSSGGGRDFGSFLGAVAQLGYGFAYRVLDAQYFGVAQRRRRVFVVGYLGDWRPAAKVLFEPESLRGNPAPSREAGKVAPTIPSRSTAGGGLGTDFDCDGGVIQQKQWPAEVSSTLDTTFGTKQGLEDQHVNAGCPLFVPAFQGIAHSLRGEGFDASEDGVAQPISYGIPGNWIGRAPENGGNSTQFMEEVAPCLTSADKHGVAQPVAFHPTQDPISSSEVCHSIGANENATAAVAFHENQRAEVTLNDTAGSLKVAGGNPGQGYPALLTAMQVRRLTPRECERLQGFPDNYTAIPWRKKPTEDCPDGPRYKALGNSMAVPVMAWIGKRIANAS